MATVLKQFGLKASLHLFLHFKITEEIKSFYLLKKNMLLTISPNIYQPEVMTNFLKAFVYLFAGS